MNLILYLLINAFSVFVASKILPGVRIESFTTALIVAVVLGAVNTFIKPLLILLTLPLTIITLGLFTFIINGLLILLVSKIVPGFFVANFWWAILFSLLISLVGSFLHSLTRR